MAMRLKMKMFHWVSEYMESTDISIKGSKQCQQKNKDQKQVDGWMTACSQDFRLKQRYIFRGNLDWSFIKHLADRKSKQRKFTNIVKNIFLNKKFLLPDVGFKMKIWQ